MTTMLQGKRVVEACGLRGEVKGDRLCIYTHSQRLDMDIETVVVFLDERDGRWTAVNKRPDLTGHSRDECVAGFGSFDEALITSLFYYLGKENKLRQLGLISDR